MVVPHFNMTRNNINGIAYMYTEIEMYRATYSISLVLIPVDVWTVKI